MKNISKRIITVVMMVVLLIALAGIEVKAAEDSVTMSLSTSDKLVAGSTITINVDFKKSNTAGIGSVLGTLNYDENVLEYVSTTAKSDWNTNYAPSTKKLGIERNNKTTTTGTIATITFKVKDSITVSKTTITYNIYDISIGETVSINTSVSLDPNNSSSSDGSYTPAGTTNTTPATSSNKNTTATNSKKNTAKNAITSSKTTSKKLPKAGDVASIVVISVVSIIAIVAIVNFIRYSKNKDIK